MSYLLYAHILPNNKLYFGITSNSFDVRCQKNGIGYKTQRLFWRAIQKYGWDNIEHIVLMEGLSKEVACECEKYLIAKYQTTNPKYGYNVYIGGDLGPIGKVASDETKEKLRQSHLGKTDSLETRLKKSLALKGKPHSKEHSKKVGDAIRGRKLTLEQRQKLSDAHKGCKLSAAQKHKISESMSNYYQNLSEEDKLKWSSRLAKFHFSKQRVILYENDIKIKEFESSKKCAEFLGVSPAMVCCVIANKKRYRNYKIEKA